MTVLLYLGLTCITFVLMEGVTWCTHKYIMHGFLWTLHRDHHQPGYHSVFERNDWFFVIFATPSILLFYFGAVPELNVLFFVGLGVFLYGLAYFLVHEVIIHQRFKWIKRVKWSYIKALRKAHKVHHKHLGKEDGECFGMLLVPRKYFKEQNR